MREGELIGRWEVFGAFNDARLKQMRMEIVGQSGNVESVVTGKN
jgi:hypothetical protein